MSGKENPQRKGDYRKKRKENRPDTTYSLDDKYLGHALIVNNLKREMPGSEKDVEKLEAVYKEMGFAVHIRRDCNKKDMNKIQREMINGKNHENSCCFMITIMTHGDDKGQLMIARETDDCDDIPGWKVEKIVEDLNSVAELVGKPKLFFIYACRGEKVTEGVKPLKSTKSKVADKADFYIAYGTVQDHIAPGPASSGSDFLQLLAKSLHKFYKRYSIDRIFTYVRRQIATKLQIVEDEEDGRQKVRQCLEDRSTLRFVLDFSEFKMDEEDDDEDDGEEEIDELTWLSEQEVTDSEEDSPEDSPERKKRKSEDKRKHVGAQQSGAVAKQEEEENVGKESTAKRPPPGAKDLTDQHVLKISQEIGNKNEYNSLATALGYKNAQKNITNNPEIGDATHAMLREWRNSIGTKREQYRILWHALDTARLAHLQEQLE